jgi:hypothetical protein
MGSANASRCQGFTVAHPPKSKTTLDTAAAMQKYRGREICATNLGAVLIIPSHLKAVRFPGGIL